jgi:hypothetical protein
MRNSPNEIARILSELRSLTARQFARQFFGSREARERGIDQMKGWLPGALTGSSRPGG